MASLKARLLALETKQRSVIYAFLPIIVSDDTSDEAIEILGLATGKKVFRENDQSFHDQFV